MVRLAQKASRKAMKGLLIFKLQTIVEALSYSRRLCWCPSPSLTAQPGLLPETSLPASLFYFCFPLPLPVKQVNVQTPEWTTWAHSDSSTYFLNHPLCPYPGSYVTAAALPLAALQSSSSFISFSKVPNHRIIPTSSQHLIQRKILLPLALPQIT